MRAYDITKAQQDLRYLSWNEHDNPSGLHVQDATAREGTGTRAILYRAPSVRVGLRSVPPDGANELVACRLMDALKIPHADTRLINALVCIAGEERPLWVTRYKKLRGAGVRFMPLEAFFELRGQQGESPLDFCARMGWELQVAQMMLIDYLTANRTRSARELYVQVNPHGSFNLAPLMGGRVALSSSFNASTWRVNAMADLSTSNYLGSASLEENLHWALKVFEKTGAFPDVVHEPAVDLTLPCKILTGRTRRELFRSLESVYCSGSAQLEGSWQVIRRRWEHYARLCRV